MSARRRGAVAALVLWIVWLAAGPARAAGEDGCAIVDAWTELRAREQAALRAVCRTGTIDEPAVVASAAFRVHLLGGPRAAALGKILAPRDGSRGRTIGAGASDTIAAQELLASLPSRIAASAGAGRRAPAPCGELMAEVRTFAEASDVGEPAGAPFLHDDPALARCLGEAAALQRVELVTLRADNIESAVVVAATPESTTVTRLVADEAVVLGRRRFLVAAVPPSASVTLIAKVRGVEVPAVWQGLVPYDLVAWTEAPAMTCLSLDVSLDADAALFLDGVPVPAEGREIARTLSVSREDHQLVVLACPAGAERCHVRYQTLLTGETLQRRVHDCRTIRLDLARGAKDVVAIVQATQNEACREAPLRADSLPGMAAEYLRVGRPRARYEFRNLAAIAALTDALVTLRGRLNQESGEVVGAERGADSARLISGAANEAWRQGIDVLLSFELRCSRSERGWRYQLETKALALSSMFGRGQSGGDGLDLQGLIDVEAEELVIPERYRQALEMTIDRLLGIEYVRLMHYQVSAPYQQTPELRVARHDGRCVDGACPPRRLLVTARRVAAAGRPAVCAQLEQHAARSSSVVEAAQRAYAAASGRELPLELTPDASGGDDARAAVMRTRLAAQRPGWYIVLARWADAEAAGDALCVELTTATQELWFDAAMSGRGLHLLPRGSPEELYLRTRIGYTRYLRPSFGLGSFLGYAYTRYALADGRPSWSDLASLDMSALRWQRHALLIGGLVEYRSRIRPLPFDIRLRAAPTLSVGVLDESELPHALKQLLGEDSGKEDHVDVDFNLHFDVGISYAIGPVTINNLLQVGFNALDDGLRRPREGIRSNEGMFIGFGLGIGVAR